MHPENPKTCLHWASKRLQSAWVQALIEKSARHLRSLFTVKCAILDSTGASLRSFGFKRRFQRKPYWKLHALAEYAPWAHRIWFAAAKATRGYIHDVVVGRQLLEKAPPSELYADRAYDDKKLYKRALQLGFEPCMQQRKNAASRRGIRGVIWRNYDDAKRRKYRGRIEAMFGGFANRYGSRISEQRIGTRRRACLLRAAAHNVRTLAKSFLNQLWDALFRAIHLYSMYLLSISVKSELQKRNGSPVAQTSIEYLLLIGAAVVFTIIVTLVTRDIIFPTGENVEIRGSNIATAQASFNIPRSSLVVPSATVTAFATFTGTATPGPDCILDPLPIWGIGPFSSTLTATFTDLEAGITDALIKCNATDAGVFISIVGNTAARQCDYVLVAATELHDVSAEAGNASCTNQVSNNPPGSISPTPSPSATASIGPCVVGDPCGGSYCLVYTNSSCPPPTYDDDCTCVYDIAACTSCGKSNDVNMTCPPGFTKISDCSTECENPCLEGGTCGTCFPDYCTAVCTYADLSSLCNVNSCDLNISTFFDFVLRPNHSGSPPQIRAYDPIDLCENVGACEGKPCRIRGSRIGDNSCYLVEDWTDFDWNDLVWSTRLIPFEAGNRMLEVKIESCSSAAQNELSIELNFPTPTQVRFLETANTTFGISHTFVVFDRPCTKVGETFHFFISDTAGTNTPPSWASLPLPQPIAPANSVPTEDLRNYILDDFDLPGDLIFQIIEQNSSVTTCVINSGHDLDCTGIAYGGSHILLSATDTGALSSTASFSITVGPKLTLPIQMFVSVNSTNSTDIYNYIFDPEFADNLLNYNVTSVSNSTAVNCTIPDNWHLICGPPLNGTQNTSSVVMISAKNPNGASTRDYMDIFVTA